MVAARDKSAEAGDAFAFLEARHVDDLTDAMRALSRLTTLSLEASNKQLTAAARLETAVTDLRGAVTDLKGAVGDLTGLLGAGHVPATRGAYNDTTPGGRPAPAATATLPTPSAPPLAVVDVTPGGRPAKAARSAGSTPPSGITVTDRRKVK